MNLTNLSLCDRERYHVDNVNQTTKIRYVESFFDFICNLNNNEYQGFLNLRNLRNHIDEPMNECYNLIMRNFTSSVFPDYCKLVL